MKTIDSLLNQLQEIADHPGEAVRLLRKESGKKLVGFAPYYAPEEIAYAAGMMPVGVWGGKVNYSAASHYLPGFACPLMKSLLELAIKGAYDGLAAMIFPGQCENNKLTGQNFKVARRNIPFIPLIHPQNRKSEEGVEYLTREYGRIAAQLEAIAGAKITIGALNQSIDVYNDYRRTMRRFCELAPRYGSTIRPRIRHSVIKSAYFMDKATHTELVGKLNALLEVRPEEPTVGKRVVITGILSEPVELMELFEELQIQVVADDLAQGSRHFRVDVPDGRDPLERLARMWALLEGCSLVFDPEKRRGQILKALVQRHQADGVVVLMTQFCDPEELDYPIYKKELEAEGIPLLFLEVEPHMQMEQARTRLESFAEMLQRRQ